ncbi:MAG: ABC transporter ATP-binding protein [Planctomycetota bacterium]
MAAREANGLSVKGLEKTYRGGVKALVGVDLEVKPGMYGLLGPNGAGKTTLMRTLATLLRPDAGTFALDGVDGLEDPDGLRRQLGYLPQHVGAYPGVAARSLLERFAWLKGITERKTRTREVDRLLERVNLSDAADREVSTFSGGMMRRFGIALALLGRPRLIIVDEPTAGLDPAERNRFHQVLADTAHDAVVLLSTHIVDDVESLCEELSIMDAGAIVASGSPEALRAPLQGRLWTRVVPRGDALPDDRLHTTATPRGTRVVVEADAAPDDGWLPHEPHLEDVYHRTLAQGRDGSTEARSLAS